MSAAQREQYKNGISFEQAVDMVRHEFNVNYEVMLSQLAPQEVFIESGTEGTGRDAEDYNLLFHAIKSRNRSCIELVLQKMLNLHGPTSFHWANDKGTTALHLAVKERHLTLVRFLLEDGKCDPSPRMRRDGWTPLHTAANRRENIKMIRMLVMYGADVNAAVSGSGWTPLHGAVMEKDKESVEYLLRHGLINLNLKASKRDVANGAKLTARELAVAIQFEPMSVFDETPEAEPEPKPETAPKVTPSPEPKATSSPAVFDETPDTEPEPKPEPAPKVTTSAREGGEKKTAYTEAELEAMIQARVDMQVEKALAAKIAEIMKVGEGVKKRADPPPEEEKVKSSEDLEVEAAMDRMRADEALERAAKQ